MQGRLVIQKLRSLWLSKILYLMKKGKNVRSFICCHYVCNVIIVLVVSLFGFSVFL